MTGYIKLYRKLLDNPVFQNANLLKTFVWCLLKASHKTHQMSVGHQMVELQPGQFIFGRHKASVELGLKPSTLNDHMKTLKTRQIIDIKPNNKYSLITVLNWGFYQSSEDEPDSKTDTKSDNKPTQTRMVMNDLKYTEHFESLWALYPRKEGKQQILKSVVKLKEIANVDFNKMSQAIENYRQVTKGRDKQYIMQGGRFFNGAYKDYLPENYEGETPQQSRGGDYTYGYQDFTGQFRD